MKKKLEKSIEVKVQRTIAASPKDAYEGWLNPEVPGTPWSEADKLVLDTKVDGLFYWYINEVPHFGRFTKLNPGERIQHTWMSPYTEGFESTVTVTFEKKGSETLMTLLHTGLPDTEDARGHEEGWTHFVGNFSERFGRKN